MPSREKYVPKHRSAPPEPVLVKKLRKSATFSGVAVLATGMAVSGGVVLKDRAPAETAATAITAGHTSGESVAAAPEVDADRRQQVSRSDRRPALDPTKQQVLEQEPGGQVTRTEDVTKQDPRQIARDLLPEFGFAASEFGCLDQLYVSESNWRVNADNPTSSAYGIPQALTGGTHKDLPADYRTNPVSQIRWGLKYIRDSYGTPCAAWSFKRANNWY